MRRPALHFGSVPQVGVQALVRRAFESWTCVLALAMLAVPDGVLAQDAAAAERAAKAGNYEQAEAEYRKLVKAQPQSAELWSNLGSVQAMGGDCARASGSLARARALEPRLFSPWYFAGVCEISLHQDSDAAAHLARAVQINPLDPNAWFLKGQAEANLDRLGQAFRSVMRSLQLDPDRAEAYYLAGKMALDLTHDCYDRVIAAPEPNFHALVLEGERNASQGVTELARQSYKKALELQPDNPVVRFDLGSAELGAGKASDAESDFRRVLELAPGARWAQIRLAMSLEGQGRVQEAATQLSELRPQDFVSVDEFKDYIAAASSAKLADSAARALELGRRRFPRDRGLTEAWTASAAAGTIMADPRNLTGVGLSIRFLLVREGAPGPDLSGVFHAREGYEAFRQAFLNQDWAAAGEAAAGNLELPPADPGKALALGEVLHNLSVGFFERLGTSYPDSTPAQLMAAENFAAMGEHDKAAGIYQDLLRKDGPSPGVLRNLAELYWSEHQWDEALRVLNSLAKIDGGDGTIFVNIGRIYAYEQQTALAEENFRRAAALAPEMPEAHLSLARTLVREGREEDAIGEFRRASALDPANARPHYELAQIYRKQGRKEMAEKELSEFTRLEGQARAEAARRSRQFVPLDE